MPAARQTTTIEPATTVQPTPRSRRNRRLAIGGAIVTTLTLTLAGCGDKFAEPFKDAPRSVNENGAPMDLIRMADGFSFPVKFLCSKLDHAVGSKCDGPNRVYVVYQGDNKYGSLAVVANDPRCTK